MTALSADPHQFREIGTPPYNVAKVAEELNMDGSNLRKYLLNLEAQGIVAREYRKVQSWNAIANNHVDRKCLCFWNAATMQQDKIDAADWDSGRATRSAAALKRLY